jgi:Predicted flavoproteins
VVNNYKFLYSSIYSYNQKNVMEDFISWGLKLKTERGNRVFPVSDHSSDVIKALETQLNKKGVKVLLNTAVKELMYTIDDSESADRRITGVLTNKGAMDADVVVLATGGLSYPQTGSTGDGFNILTDALKDDETLMQKALSPMIPALCPLVIRESFCHDMMGLSLRNVKLRADFVPDDDSSEKDSSSNSSSDDNNSKKRKKSKKVLTLYEEQGEMLFTHFGITGPLVLSASSHIGAYIRKSLKKLSKERVNNVNAFFKEVDGRVVISLDLKPALSEEELDRRVERDFTEFSNREFSNSLGKLLPRLLIPVIVAQSGIKPEKKVNLITREERQKLVRLLKDFRMTVAGFKGFNEAIITSGGISTSMINSSTMEIKGFEGLRAAGEIIDVDALTGGFNLQIAWCTANLAAR